VEGQSVGLIVNSASEVLKIPPSDVEVPRNLFSEGELNYISGVGKLNGRLILILDLTRILQRGELRSAGAAAEIAAIEA
jgi:purine-binding chemotaxis protein CheW